MRRASRPLAVTMASMGCVVMSTACSAFEPVIGGLRSTGAASEGGVDAEADVTDMDTGMGTEAPVGDGVVSPMTYTVIVAPGGSHVFGPSMLAVHAGDTVHWVWQGDGHTVTSDTGLFCSPSASCSNQPTSSTGATYDHVFAAAGTFPYHCLIHVDMGMVGSITVQ